MANGKKILKKKVLSFKPVKVGATILATVLATASLSACVNNNNTITSLKMSDLNYDEMTKNLNWKGVKGATSYEVFIDGIDDDYVDKLLVVKEPKVDFSLEPTGDYEVGVKAKNSRLESNETVIEISHIKAEQLIGSTPELDQKGQFLYWSPVKDAVGYSLTIKGAGEDINVMIDNNENYNETTGRYEYALNDRIKKALFNIQLVALGDKVNCSDSIEIKKEFILYDQSLIKNLEMSDVVYSNGKLIWLPVENATRYTVEILENNNVIKQNLEYIYNEKSGMFECDLDAVKPGMLSAKVVAKGNNQLIGDSQPAISSEFDKPVSYTNFASRLAEKLIPDIKWMSRDNEVRDINIFGVEKDGSKAYFSFYSPMWEETRKNPESFASAEGLNLGQFESFDIWYNKLDNFQSTGIYVNINSKMKVEEELLFQFVDEMIKSGRVENFTPNEISVDNISEIYLKNFIDGRTEGYMLLDNGEMLETKFLIQTFTSITDEDVVKDFLKDSSILSKKSSSIVKHSLISENSYTAVLDSGNEFSNITNLSNLEKDF